MTALWCPGARKIDLGPGLQGCGAMLGGPPRAIHHTTEGGTIAGAVNTYRQTGSYPTITADYAKDDVAQHIPADQGATAVEHHGQPETNREGTVCVQIEWVGQAVRPFTQGHAAGPKVKQLLDWLRSLGIPDVWPAGAPLPYPKSYGLDNGQRNAKTWAEQAGHYGHSQVPGNVHGDPGAIDPEFVKQTAKPPAPHGPWHTRLLELTTPAMHGADVAHVQQWLIDHKLLAGGVDGVYGSLTADAVGRLQTGKGLPHTGKVDNATARYIP